MPIVLFVGSIIHKDCVKALEPFQASRYPPHVFIVTLD